MVINRILNKKFVTYAEKNLVLIMIIKNIIKYTIITTALGNIEALLVMFAT